MNPFKKDGQIQPIASINSVYVEDTLASDLFRPAKLFCTVNENRETLGFSHAITTDQLMEAYTQKLKENHPKAKEIASMYGRRLATVLLTLFKPSNASKNNRPIWTENHWNYWKQIEHVYFVGGFTSPIITKIFLKEINNMLKQYNIHDKIVTFVNYSSHLGTKGLSTKVNNGEALLFDFGQTNIKRTHHIKKHGETTMHIDLDTIKAQHLAYKDLGDKQLYQEAEALHNFIIGILLKTIKEVDFKGSIIHIAIANYVFNGSLYQQRGGYGKLALLHDHYQSYLQEELIEIYNNPISIQLFHDTSAMALSFPNEPNAAVISLGTAFGVSFLDT